MKTGFGRPDCLVLPTYWTESQTLPGWPWIQSIAKEGWLWTLELYFHFSRAKVTDVHLHTQCLPTLRLMEALRYAKYASSHVAFKKNNLSSSFNNSSLSLKPTCPLMWPFTLSEQWMQSTLRVMLCVCARIKDHKTLWCCPSLMAQILWWGFCWLNISSWLIWEIQEYLHSMCVAIIGWEVRLFLASHNKEPFLIH